MGKHLSLSISSYTRMKIHQLSFSLLLVLIFASCASAPKMSSPETVETKMVEAMKWQEANPIYSQDPTDWTNGAYYTGVARAYESTKNPVFLKAIEDMGNRTGWKTWLDPTARWIEDHLYKNHKWKEGDKSIKEEILWWWCDALFMAPPVLVRWANLKNDRRYLQQMHKYYMETYDLLYDQEEHLFARDTRFVWTGSADDRKGGSGKKIFWSRGNGWVIGGLALILEEMPVNYEHRDFYVNLYKEMAAKIKKIQPEDGLWRVSLLEPEAWDHGETSGSGFYTFALAWGINNGLLDRKEYLPVVAKAWKSLEGVQQADGKVAWVQNIGYDPKPASADSWQNFGTGAFLMAGSEVRKIK